jgi:3-methyladenine DNA glycosylase AlkD
MSLPNEAATGVRMTAIQIRKQLLRDLASVLTKDDDLMPSEFADDSREAKAWIKARDDLASELERRGQE